jgi:hypothetical protein
VLGRVSGPALRSQVRSDEQPAGLARETHLAVDRARICASCRTIAGMIAYPAASLNVCAAPAGMIVGTVGEGHVAEDRGRRQAGEHARARSRSAATSTWRRGSRLTSVPGGMPNTIQAQAKAAQIQDTAERCG